MSDINNKSTETFGKILCEWSFMDAPQYKRTVGWYFFMIAVFGSLAIYSIVVDNFIFLFLIILFVLVIFISHRNASKMEFKITQDGIMVGNKFYPYKDIEKFWIIYQPPYAKTLYFHIKSFFNPRLPIPLEQQNPVHIRKILLDYIPEDLEQENEPFSDK